MDNLHYLLKHPVLMAFLELELNSLRLTYFFDFLVYLVFVVILFTYLGDRYGLFVIVAANHKEATAFTTSVTGPVGIYTLILGIYICLLILRYHF